MTVSVAVEEAVPEIYQLSLVSIPSNYRYPHTIEVAVAVAVVVIV